MNYFYPSLSSTRSNTEWELEIYRELNNIFLQSKRKNSRYDLRRYLWGYFCCGMLFFVFFLVFDKNLVLFLEYFFVWFFFSYRQIETEKKCDDFHPTSQSEKNNQDKPIFWFLQFRFGKIVKNCFLRDKKMENERLFKCFLGWNSSPFTSSAPSLCLINSKKSFIKFFFFFFFIFLSFFLCLSSCPT